jgi:hypothetical protein
MILMDQLLILVFLGAIGVGVHATHDGLLVIALSLEFLVVVFL